ncbi:MAG TPA: cation:proton antiporter [Longimicrobiales bacterium]
MIVGAPAPGEAASLPQLLLVLAVILIVAKAVGEVAERIGQPAVLGEMLGGLLLGPSLLGIVNPADPLIHTFAELGVILLLFGIGLETDLKKLMRVGGAAATVALVGVVLPFGLGYAIAQLFGLTTLESIIIGAAMTATSVGITARVLADLGRLHAPESQVILGAAVIDDVVGLIILALVAQLAAGTALTVIGVATSTAAAFGFIIAALFVGNLVLPPLLRRVAQKPEIPVIVALAAAFLFASLADRFGSATIIGAFSAGLVLARTQQAHHIEHNVSRIALFFVPIFFVSVGAAVDVRSFADARVLLIGSALIVAGAAGKFIAGFCAVRFQGRRTVIGVGMIPRGEVGLIFAQTGLASGALSQSLFNALAMMVVGTTFMAPPLLRSLFGGRAAGAIQETGAVADVTTRI